MTDQPAALLPPDPSVSGWHYVTMTRGDPPDTQAWYWSADEQLWDMPVPPVPAYAAGWRYVRPIPSADRLAAMEEIVAIHAEALASYEAHYGHAPDDKTGFSSTRITAGMIRRAVGS